MCSRVRLIQCLLVWSIGGVWIFATIPTSAQVSTSGRNSTAAETLKLAHGLLQRGRYLLAADQYTQFLEQQPSGPSAWEARYFLGFTRRSLGQPARAREQFAQYLRESPTDHPYRGSALFQLGEADFRLDQPEEAQTALTQFVREYPDHSQIGVGWEYLGEIALRNRKWAEARRAFEEAMRRGLRGPSAPRARYGLGLALMALDEDALALRAFERLEGTDDDWSAKARLRIGKIHRRAGRLEAADETLAVLERDTPNHRLVPEARFLRGEMLIERGRDEEAIAIWGPVAASEAETWAVRTAYHLGLVLRRQGRPDEALVVWDRTLQRFPDTTWTAAFRFRTAETLAQLGQSDLARQRFEQLVDEAPEDPWANDALVRAAELAWDQQQVDQAGRIARRLLDRTADRTQHVLAKLILARVARTKQVPDQAIAALEPELASLDLQNDPTTPDAKEVDANDSALSTDLAVKLRFELALAYCQAGRDAEASALLDRLAQQSGPLAAPSLYLLGKQRFEAGAPEEAVGPLGNAIAADPDAEWASQARAYLVLALESLGRMDEGLEILDDWTLRKPDDPTLTTVRIRLAESALDAGNSGRAITLFEEALIPIADDDRRDASGESLAVRARVGLAYALLNADQPDRAAEQFAAVLDMASASDQAPEWLYYRGLAWRRLGQTERAEQDWLRVRNEFTDSVWAQPSRIAGARLLAQEGRYDEAAALFAQAVEALDARGKGPPLANPDPETVEADRRGPAELGDLDRLLADWAWTLIDAGRDNEADQLFQRLVEQMPESPLVPEARLALAESAYNRTDLPSVLRWLMPFEQAEVSSDDLVEAPKFDPVLRQSVLYLLGRVALDQHRWDDAQQWLTRLIEANPELSLRREAAFWIAESLLQAGDAAQAAREFQELAFDMPDDPPVSQEEPWRATAQLRYVQALVQQERWDDVLEVADQLIRQRGPRKGRATDRPNPNPEEDSGPESSPDPWLAELAFARGRAWQQKARFEEALEAYRQVTEYWPHSMLAARAQLMRGEVHYHQEDYQAALKELYHVDIFYDAPTWEALALLEIGKIYQRLDRPDDAYEAYRRIIKDFPDSPASEQAVQLQRQLAKPDRSDLPTDTKEPYNIDVSR